MPTSTCTLPCDAGPLRRRVVVAALLGATTSSSRGQDAGLRAPNVVPITETLVTSGQPRAEALADLSRLGFQVVVYLAPGTVADAVPEEPALLKRQGIEYVHVPIPFAAPEEKHYGAVAEALSRHAGRKTLVHCQVNMRASSMVFLYRVIAAREPAASAYEAVTRVWSPEGAWRTFIIGMLRKHGVGFEPY